MPILLIEDNPADAYLVKTYLNDASVRHELYHADTLFEGLNTLRERDIQMVLLDLKLPDSDGFKTLTTLMERSSNVPVIVMTGMNNEIVGNQAVRAGAQDFLVKGQFDGKLLGRAIRYAQQRFKEQQKRDETLQSLALAEKRYAEAQSMGRFGNWQMDIVTNEMVWTDEVFRIFGFQGGSVQPALSVYLNYTHPEDRAQVDDFFENAVKNGQQQQIEHRLVLNGTNVKYVSVMAKINIDDANGGLQLVGIVQDITERKLSERLLLEKSLSQKSNRMKEEVLADMSFHIRTPLNSIVNFLYLLDKDETKPEQKEYIKNIRASVDDLSIIINNLLNLSTLSTEKMKLEEEAFVFQDFFQSIQKLVQFKAESSGVAVRYDIDMSFPDRGLGDMRKLTQVLYNILHNAVRLSSPKKEVKVEIKPLEADGKSLLLHCRIHDSGRPFAPDKIRELLNADNLLKTYTETESNGDEKMHEIGIAIAAKLASLLGGKLEITNEVEGGNTYLLQIPMRVAKSVRARPGESPDNPLRVLLVEDNPMSQIAARKLLTAWSEHVTVDLAENGLVGVEKFREYGYDLVLMDVRMPEMDGIEATKRIRERSSVPIIAITASASRQEMERCFGAGMNDYIPKPIQAQDFYARILNAIAVLA